MEEYSLKKESVIKNTPSKIYKKIVDRKKLFEKMKRKKSKKNFEKSF